MTYDSIRATLQTPNTTTQRVEVNQRALIDKILARYATAGAVYRELIQNSNDADATIAEIRFSSIVKAGVKHVNQVVYRNNGMFFRPQDWDRLRKIAEGNPDVSKVGAFGVGAYTMFSICEEPMVISGDKALAFVWRGDALWTKSAPVPHDNGPWTTFVLPSRDLYPVPDLTQFGKFLCATLTFTQALHQINVFLDDKLVLELSKKTIKPPTVVTPPRASSWWSNDGSVLQSPQKIFTLDRSDGAITESIVEIAARLGVGTPPSSLRARFVSATANVRVPHDMARKMERVTKKKVPPTVMLHIFIDASVKSSEAKQTQAKNILDAFSPSLGKGSIFIGFKTSQTTGLAAHLSAPLIPTVEREAIDFQDPALRTYNCELLSVAGIVMRLILEHSMSTLGVSWEETKPERERLELALRNEKRTKKEASLSDAREEDKPQSRAGPLSGFAKFMSGSVKVIASVISSAANITLNEDEDLLNPPDPRPLSREEEEAILLMRCFCPEQSTPSAVVGSVIADGFVRCMPKLPPPVLTRSGVVRSTEARLPYKGMEAFVTKNVVRSIMFKNAEKYMVHVAPCTKLQPVDLESFLKDNPLTEEQLVRLMKWWTVYCRNERATVVFGPAIKQAITYFPSKQPRDAQNDVRRNTTAADSNSDERIHLRSFEFYHDRRVIGDQLPLPSNVLPRHIQQLVGQRLLEDRPLAPWFRQIPFRRWAEFICQHACMADGRMQDANVRLEVLTALSKHYMSRTEEQRIFLGTLLSEALANMKCIPVETHDSGPKRTGCPPDVYLSSAQIAIFEGLGSFEKVSPELESAGVSDRFLLAIGVRKTISIDFLFTQLDNLKWSSNPKPLISYLQSASLTKQDLEKLKTVQYLPEAKDKSRMYAPSEIFLPDPELKIFPFVKVLQWPATEHLNEHSAEGMFLKTLGCQIHPNLGSVLNYAAQQDENRQILIQVLDFLAARVGPGDTSSVYDKEFMSGSLPGTFPPTKYREIKFLPVIRKNFVDEDILKELSSPNDCYSDPKPSCLGFAVLDPDLGANKVAIYSHNFRVTQRPTPDRLIEQFLNVITYAKRVFSRTADESSKEHLLSVFRNIFAYLSLRTSEFENRQLSKLRGKTFIPARTDKGIGWFRCDALYFTDDRESSDMPSSLFQTVEFSPFLSAVGVKSEPSIADLFQILVANPQKVLDSLGGEEKYRNLLRRFAANSEMLRQTDQSRRSPFLLAFRMDSDHGFDPGHGSNDMQPVKKTYQLAKAMDISIIDNSSFARMFNVLTAPAEPLLERFYLSLGSQYISKRIKQSFQMLDRNIHETELTIEFRKRVRERLPLLLYPHTTTRKLQPDAAKQLEDANLEVYEVRSVKAIYSLGGTERSNDITCCVTRKQRQRTEICLKSEFDWFDVGNGIAALILQKSHLEDAFFIGSLLEAPLDQLRARGFPVDRLVTPAELRPAPAAVPQASTIKPTANNMRGARKKPSSAATPSAVKPLQVSGRQHKSPDSIQPGSSQPKKQPKNDTTPGSSTKDEQQPQTEGFGSILQAMFPDCDPQHINRLLGPNPNLEKLRELANGLINGNYPKKPSSASTESTTKGETTPPANVKPPADVKPPAFPPFKSWDTKGGQKQKVSKVPKGASGSGLLSRALRGMRANSFLPGIAATGANNTITDSNTPVQPEETRNNNKVLQDVLNNSISSSSKVSSRGLSAPERLENNIPIELQRNEDGCNVIPGHELVLWSGRNGTGKSFNGIKVFASCLNSESEAFLDNNMPMIDTFGVILQSLSEVYSLKLDAVAMFHEAGGRSIAFNLSGALYFNIRFYAALHHHAERHPDNACYAYWYTTMAHELAHNLVKAHNKEHGYYTESYVSNFLPQLLGVLPY